MDRKTAELRSYEPSFFERASNALSGRNVRNALARQFTAENAMNIPHNALAILNNAAVGVVDASRYFLDPERAPEPTRGFMPNALAKEAAGQAFDGVGNTALAALPATMAMRGGGMATNALGAHTKQAAPLSALARDVDELGFYSHALEAAKALKQAKGTPQQMRAQLRKAGVKEAELDATGFDEFATGKGSVQRDELVNHLAQARVRPRVATYGNNPNQPALDDIGNKLAHLDDVWEGYRADGVAPGLWSQPARDMLRVQRDIDRLSNEQRRLTSEVDLTPTYHAFSLDKGNPTYREDVMYLPSKRNDVNPEKIKARAGKMIMDAERELLLLSDRTPSYFTTRERVENLKRVAGDDPRTIAAIAEYKRLEAEAQEAAETFYDGTVFRSGHWSEPNVIAHLRTSQHKDASGNSHYVLNELQSDWGQALRGSKDSSERVAGLKDEITSAEQELTAAGVDHAGVELSGGRYRTPSGDILPDQVQQRLRDLHLRRVELAQATQDIPPGHPLVNSTDQWVNTGLRRYLNQAVESGADSLSIASGDTVWGYGMGAPLDGLRYGYDKMYPKKMRDILKKIDPEAAQAQRVETLQGHTGDAVGRGFTTFPVTDKLRDAVRQGLPLFSDASRTAAPAALFMQQGQRPLPERMYRGSDGRGRRTGEEGADLGRFRAGRRHGAVFLAQDPAIANEYAGASTGSRVAPAQVTGGNYFDYRNPEHARAAANLKIETPDGVVIDEGNIGQYELYENPQLRQWIEKEGYDGYWEHEGARPDSASQDNLAVITQGNVRSPFTGNTLYADASRTAAPAALIANHSQALQEASLDPARFNQAFQQLASDPNVTDEMLDKIGEAYTHSPKFSMLYGTRAEKLQRLQDAFRGLQEFESRAQAIDASLPWQGGDF